MQDSLVSILTPFKNTASYIEECLRSIISQTYRNWELVIIDDHSADNSFELVEQFAKLDNRIRLYKSEGTGIIDALRTAYSKAQGQYITRMDSDDLMQPEKLALMVKDMVDYGKGHVALGLVSYFHKDGINEGYLKYEKWLNKLSSKGNNFTEIYKECVIPSPCWMLHRQDLDKCGAFKPDRYPEDYDLAFRMYQNKIICIPTKTVLHLWRDYSNRTSRTDAHYAQNYFLELKLHYFLKLNYDANRTLTVWGAGGKGKNIARLLINYNVEFIWICDNPKKIGKEIYGQQMKPFSELQRLNNPQSIVTVANEEAQIEITSYFRSQNMWPMNDYFFFC